MTTITITLGAMSITIQQDGDDTRVSVDTADQTVETTAGQRIAAIATEAQADNAFGDLVNPDQTESKSDEGPTVKPDAQAVKVRKGGNGKGYDKTEARKRVEELAKDQTEPFFVSTLIDQMDIPNVTPQFVGTTLGTLGYTKHDGKRVPGKGYAWAPIS